MITVELLPGVQYYFVTSAFAAPGSGPDGGPFVGDYSNIIAGAGNVTLGLVPEPRASAAFLLLVGLLLWKRP